MKQCVKLAQTVLFSRNLGKKVDLPMNRTIFRINSSFGYIRKGGQNFYYCTQQHCASVLKPLIFIFTNLQNRSCSGWLPYKQRTIPMTTMTKANVLYICTFPLCFDLGAFSLSHDLSLCSSCLSLIVIGSMFLASVIVYCITSADST